MAAGAVSVRSTPPTKRETRAKRAKPDSCASVDAAEEAPRLEKEPAEQVPVQTVRVEGGERAEARAHRRAGARKVRCLRELVQRGNDLGRERVGVARRRGVRLVPVPRRPEQRGAERPQLELRDRRVEQAEQGGVLRVLGPVVDDEERQRGVRLRAVRRPELAGDVRAQQPRPDRDLLAACLRAPPRPRSRPAARSPRTRAPNARRTGCSRAAGSSGPRATRSSRRRARPRAGTRRARARRVAAARGATYASGHGGGTRAERHAGTRRSAGAPPSRRRPARDTRA